MRIDYCFTNGIKYYFGTFWLNGCIKNFHLMLSSLTLNMTLMIKSWSFYHYGCINSLFFFTLGYFGQDFISIQELMCKHLSKLNLKLTLSSD